MADLEDGMRESKCLLLFNAAHHPPGDEDGWMHEAKKDEHGKIHSIIINMDCYAVIVISPANAHTLHTELPAACGWEMAGGLDGCQFAPAHARDHKPDSKPE